MALDLEELDHSGFIFDKHQFEFEVLDLKLAIGIMQIVLSILKRKITFLEETQYTNKRPMLAGRQILFQVYMLFNINKTHGANDELE